ncbi:MAG: hypothetical protein E7443_00575 [Ruminococcaceae bacterium]|nr:hypothetical protein [Oscillospiraceae bacterium]
MGKQQKTSSVWVVLLRSLVVAMILYMGGAAVLALLLVKGVLPETAAFPVLAVLCVAAAVFGGGLCARSLTWGTLPASLAAAALFAAVLLGVGAAFLRGIAWSAHGGVLLLCVAGGGLLSGLLGGGRTKGKRKRKKGKL